MRRAGEPVPSRLRRRTFPVKLAEPGVCRPRDLCLPVYRCGQLPLWTIFRCGVLPGGRWIGLLLKAGDDEGDV